MSSVSCTNIAYVCGACMHRECARSLPGHPIPNKISGKKFKWLGVVVAQMDKHMVELPWILRYLNSNLPQGCCQLFQKTLPPL